MIEKLGVLITGLLLLVLVFAAPLAVIWSLNTLFSLSIPYDFYTWLAVIVLGVFTRANISVKQ